MIIECRDHGTDFCHLRSFTVHYRLPLDFVIKGPLKRLRRGLGSSLTNVRVD